jgi:hypothetical protein
MGFLLSHWHCVLPTVGIAAAMFFMRDKDKRDKGKGKKDDAARDAATAPRGSRG